MATDFEEFFYGEWQRMLEREPGRWWEDRANAIWARLSGVQAEKWWVGVSVPRDQMQQPIDGEVSWDRAAAWLVYQKLRERGQAGPVQGDLFA